ncbi:hypothetical protein [Streptacidiphilus carbonis]|jgi:hypothetical protein|uniref:hypothetical protein n=1 Tax=Streptacidiphilus carbonis TaxID=105422 RepID=UPI0005AB0D2F|nr:hypothetical protein [Streptacidiphilus carbonis]
MGLFDPLPLPAARPPESELGPLPPRSRAGVWWQFWFQWLFLAVGGALLAALFAVFLAISALSPSDPIQIGGSGTRGSGELSCGDFVILSRERYRLERGGTRQQWCARIEKLLRKGVTRSDELHAKAVARAAAKNKPAPTEPRYGTVKLTAGAFRGAGPGAVAEVAERLGWEVDWERTVKERLTTVYVVRPLLTADTA